jgi:predicted nucleic acid-binding Zn ribbon protein
MAEIGGFLYLHDENTSREFWQAVHAVSKVRVQFPLSRYVSTLPRAARLPTRYT